MCGDWRPLDEADDEPLFVVALAKLPEEPPLVTEEEDPGRRALIKTSNAAMTS